MKLLPLVFNAPKSFDQAMTKSLQVAAVAAHPIQKRRKNIFNRGCLEHCQCKTTNSKVFKNKEIKK